jgi:hypothetical protein
MSSPLPNNPEKSRAERWVHSSFGLAAADRWLAQNRAGVTTNAQLVTLLQGLGRMDVELIYDSVLAAENIDAQRMSLGRLSQAQISQPDHHIYRSFLWVLAAYEFIRTLDEICSKRDPNIYGGTLNQETNRFKHNIERVRVPLAKIESSRRHPTDHPIAYPAWVNDKGVGWQVDASTVVARIDLSDELLALVENLRLNS